MGYKFNPFTGNLDVVDTTAAAGATTQVQFNDAGAFGGDSGLTFNKTTDALSAGGFIPTSSTVPANGVYLPAANSVGVATNGTGRLFVDASGNVGINAASPAGRLGVDGAVVIGNQLSTGTTTGTLRAVQSTSSVYLQTGLNTTAGSSADLVFSNINASNEWMRLTAGGRLAIGSSAPTELLSIGSGTVNGRTAVGGSSLSLLAGGYTATGAGSSIELGNGHGNSGDVASWLIRSVVVDGAGPTIKNNQLTFSTRTAFANVVTERVRLDSSGRLGIGTTGPQAIFHSKAGATTSAGIFESTSASGSFLSFADTGTNSYTRVQVGSVGNELVLRTSDQERCRVDSSGRLLVGTSSARSNFFNTTITTPFQIEGTTTTTSSISCVSNNASGNNAALILAKSNGASVGSNTLVNNGDVLGGLYILGSDGTEFVAAAQITA
jgi:hypothetical protein